MTPDPRQLDQTVEALGGNTTSSQDARQVDLPTVRPDFQYQVGLTDEEKLEADRQLQTEQQGLERAREIEKFYSSRPSDINRRVAANLDQNLARIRQQTEASERYARQNRARSGNFGGSTELEQNASIRATAQDQIGSAVGNSLAQRNQLMDQMEFQRNNELMAAFDPSGFLQTARAAQLQSMGMDPNNMAMDQMLQNGLDDISYNANRDLAAAIGGTFGTIGNIFESRAQNQRSAEQQRYQDQIIRSLGG